MTALAAATALGRSLEARVCHDRLSCDPLHYPSIHRLFDAYRRAGDLDPAFCVASVLVFLHKATPEQLALVQQHRRSGWSRPEGTLDDRTIAEHVLHRDQDRTLTELLGIVAPAIAGWRASEVPGPLATRPPVDPMMQPGLLSRVVAGMVRALEVSCPDFYLRPDEPGSACLLNVHRHGRLRPSVVVYRDLLHGPTDAQLAFELGRVLADLWRPHYCFVALDRSAAAVEQVLLACMRSQGLPVHGDASAYDAIARQIDARLSPPEHARLERAVHRLLASRGPIDVQGWARGTEATAIRVGLLMCGDLRVACRRLSEQLAPLGLDNRVYVHEQLMALLHYALSDDYFAARRALGIDVRGS